MQAPPVFHHAANFTVNELDFGYPPEMMQQAVDAFGTNIIGLLRPNEESGAKPGVFSPIILIVGGKTCAGCILTAADRAVLVWKEGAFRLKVHTASIPFDTVKNVAQGSRLSDDGQKTLDELMVEADATWTLLAPQSNNGRPKMVPYLSNIFSSLLAGAAVAASSDVEQQEAAAALLLDGEAQMSSTYDDA